MFPGTGTAEQTEVNNIPHHARSTKVLFAPGKRSNNKRHKSGLKYANIICRNWWCMDPRIGLHLRNIFHCDTSTS